MKNIMKSKSIVLRYGMITFLAVVVSYFYLDRLIALECNKLYETSIWYFFRPIRYLGEAWPYLILFGLGFIFYRYIKNNAQKVKYWLYLFATVAISGLIVDIIKWTLGRYRPSKLFNEGLYGFDFFHMKYEYISFPSGHTATVFSIAMALSYLYPKYRLIWWLLAFMVALNRIITTAHFLSDVLAAAYIGIATSIILFSKIMKN